MAKKTHSPKSLRDYITEVGDEKFAAQFGIKPRTAAAYRLGERFPTRRVLQRIVSESPLTLEDIYRSAS